jgi:tRNA C32,U32 (ribose-2'-O)-methylase TrmJ
LAANASGDNSKIRRLVRRLKLDGADAELLLGMLRQIQWKVRAQ